MGDVILYQNELGDTLKLKLIAGTKPSVFQGYVVISNKHFLKNYPSSSGSNIFLVGGDAENEIAIGDELQSVFRDYGWEMESAIKRLVEFIFGYEHLFIDIPGTWCIGADPGYHWFGR